ncbi:restriction endonuclease subunit S [Lactobacillus delbrueckii subsp. bulgaricus]|uniref:restriction endonuclease subunit S n=2 Tax=Lactobacillus delbrueckii TaxID=1584 RepID=UPI0038533C34
MYDNAFTSFFGRINDNLDELSTVIFDRWIRNSSSDVKCPLDHVAKYTNGLAMQKFRPQNNEIGLPVVKIRELNQGDTDENSDYCTSNIDQSVKVNTGDIIFSWSGTLTLDIWAGGEAGLNQHLFKVTSSKYPYWFVFEWTKYYLKSFQNIAKSKATTMGHIKRSDLHSSLVKIPTHDEMIELNTTLSPMYSQKITIRHENRVLYQMKQQLLSKYF